MEEKFVTSISVTLAEAEYLRQALASEMPLQKGDELVLESSPVLDHAELYVKSRLPLSLEQRRFLTACGLSFECHGKW